MWRLAFITGFSEIFQKIWRSAIKELADWTYCVTSLNFWSTLFLSK